MGFFELTLVALGLSMDAFAVSICKGLGMKKLKYAQALIIALFFGGFQAIMPLLGWMLGSQFQYHIENIDHWIAFVLLGFIGAKMLWDGVHSSEGECCKDETPLDLKELFMLAIATSIDALAVGITFAFLQVDIVPAVSMIGVITFALAFLGVIVGNKFGSRYEKPATIAGGVVLILIGCKILLEHLGILG